MAAEQDELMKVAEKELEELQDLAKETAQVIMGFGGEQQLSVPLSAVHVLLSDQRLLLRACFAGKIADVIEMEKFQDPQGYRAELARQKEEQRVLAEEESESKKQKKKGKKEKKKKEGEAEEEEEEEEEEVITLATPFMKKLRGTGALNKMVRTKCFPVSILFTFGKRSSVRPKLVLMSAQVEKERLRERAEQREAAAVAAEEARRKALSELVVKKTDENQSNTPKAGESKSPDKSPPKGKKGNSGKSPSNGKKGDSDTSPSNGKKKGNSGASSSNGKKGSSDASSSNGKKGDSDKSSPKGKKSK